MSVLEQVRQQAIATPDATVTYAELLQIMQQYSREIKSAIYCTSKKKVV